MNRSIEKMNHLFSSVFFYVLSLWAIEVCRSKLSPRVHVLEASCVNLRERATLSIAPRSCRNSLLRQWLNHNIASINKILFFISLFYTNLKANLSTAISSNRAPFLISPNLNPLMELTINNGHKNFLFSLNN